MVTQQIMKPVVDLVLILTLLAGIALGIGAAGAHWAQSAHAASTQHVLADVADPPPGH